MKKQDIAKGALKVLANITEREVEKNTGKWPPRCMGFFHQPKRPVQKHQSIYCGHIIITKQL